MSTPNPTMQGIMNDVYTHTNRPDLIAETQLAVAKATLKMHMQGPKDERGNPTTVFYVQDEVRDFITLPVQLTDFHYAIDISMYPSLRSVKALQEYNNPATGYEKKYTPVDPDNIFDSYGFEKYDYWYRAGTVIQLRVKAAPIQVQLSYFALPIVDGATYSSWIASLYSQAIVEEAAGTVFRMIGKDEEYKTYQMLTQENAAMLQAIGLTSNTF